MSISDLLPYAELIVPATPPPPPSTKEIKTVKLAEVQSFTEFCQSFDISAFPVPIEVVPFSHDLGMCWDCGGGIHVIMRVSPRSADEVKHVPRDCDGKVRLNTCTHVTSRSYAENGIMWATDQVRAAIRNLTIHELYESIMFKGFRMFDPHDDDLRPHDQPW